MAYTPSLPEKVIEVLHRLDHRVGWHKLPQPMGVATLIAIRERLRERNLHDTGSTVPVADLVPPATDRRYRYARTDDGTYNDLDDPAMGSMGCRFGRNVPLEYTHPDPEPDLLWPNPRDISRELMTRKRFKPAATLNVLAAAWLQFQVHDWFNHGKPQTENHHRIPLRDDDDWFENPMLLPRVTPDSSATGDEASPTWISHDSHWWDASQLYGHDKEFITKSRLGEGGKLRVDEHGLTPQDLEDGQDLSDVAGNMWIGLALLHALFTKEHNAICDRLRAEYPTWTDQQLFDKARLVNTALMVKIHTVEWTPAVIAHPTTVKGMHANWWGLAGRNVKRRFGRVSDDEAISGIPGAPTDHHGTPYSLTEEFTAVYRMHPLMPDDFEFRSVGPDKFIEERNLLELDALHWRERVNDIGADNALYSLGIAHPGAITLHNFPRRLQDLHRADGTRLDLAAVDIMRIRERGVPRYAEFRDLFHMKPVTKFEDITPNEDWQHEIRDVYEGNLDRVDLMVGLYAEEPPEGFGFSDTAFRVFVLMATRRLTSDRFFTSDYRPEVYTPEGLDWIERSTLVDVLRRHHPGLAGVLEGQQNAFAPWRRMAY